MTSDVKKSIYQSIAAFLRDECACGDYESDTVESLEVATQCIESAFGVSGETRPSIDLLSLFKKPPTANGKAEATAEDKAAAERFKVQGNALMLSEKFDEAIDCYTKAIALDSNNAIYYCNRGAAYSRLNKDENCISDCKKALEIDPSYSKAYGRMGVAYSNLGKYEKAIEVYKKAIELDPSNSNFKQNLSIAEAQMREKSAGNTGGASGGFDLGSLLNNPMMQSVAQQFISNPSMQNTFQSLMQNILGGNGSSEGENNTSSGGIPNMDELLRVGQQFARQMQETNPDLVNSLRAQMQSRPPADGNTNPDNGKAPSS